MTPNGLELPAQAAGQGAARPRPLHSIAPSWPGPLQRVVRLPYRFTRGSDPQNRAESSYRQSFFQTIYIGSLKRNCRPNLG